MFKLLALTSLLASAALAQTTASQNPLIPTGISQPCTAFLNALNTDSALANCVSTLTNITSAFAPGAPNPSSSDVTSTLTKLCTPSVTSACPDPLIRTKITAFYAACPNELTSNPNQDVRNIYDVLYTVLPLVTSICSKDDSGDSCALGPTKSARDVDEDTFSISEILALLYIKKDNGALTRRDQAIVPNFSSLSKHNLQFLFFTPDLSDAQLCVTCLRQVLTAYISFESSSPFAYGLNNSVVLGAQSALYNAVQSRCPATFLSGAVAAGGLSGSSAAIPTYGAEYKHIIALVMGAVTTVIFFAL